MHAAPVRGRFLAAALLTATAFALPASPAFADYPEREVKIIVPFPAGGTADIAARVVAAELGKSWNKPVVVDNKAGAGGNVGSAEAARATPDGYTFLMGTVSTHAINQSVYAKLPYDPVKDFTPIARGGNLPFILVVNPKRPWKTVGDLVADAKKNPGRITYASGNSTGIVAGATLANRAKIDILHVPYKGTPQSLTDVVGGQVDFMFTDLTSGLPFVQSGQLRALAVSTAERSAIIPDLPSMAEAGVPDFDLNSWNGYFGPAGMPPEIVAKLNGAINQIVAKPDVKKRLAGLGFDAFSSTPEAFAQFVGEQRDLWGKLIRDAGIEQQ